MTGCEMPKSSENVYLNETMCFVLFLRMGSFFFFFLSLSLSIYSLFLYVSLAFETNSFIPIKMSLDSGLVV